MQSPERIRDLFEQLSGLSEQERTRRLARIEDDDLRREVERLLAAASHMEGISVLEALPGARNGDPLVGMTVTHYRIDARLGEGGMGVVYRGEDTRLKRAVALKFLPIELTRDATARARFIQEARAVSALDHPNICAIYDIDETADGRTFLAMACYSGETLKEKIARGPMPVEEVLRYSIQMTDGLRTAHDTGIIHRDLKPANVMVTEQGQVKLLDFGLAKLADASLTRTGARLGTPAYMSPEQASGDEIDHRADLWSLGVVLYEMLSGRRPFTGEHELAVMYSVVHEEPEDLSRLRAGLPRELVNIVGRCMTKDRARRFESADTIYTDLLTCRDALFPPARARRPVFSRHRTAVGAALVLGVLAIGGLAIPGTRQLPGQAVQAVFGNRLPAEKHLLVLPFIDRSGSAAGQAFCDGLAEILSAQLSRIGNEPGFWVVPAGTVRSEGVRDVKKARDVFQVNLVVMGTLSGTGSNRRVTLELLNAETGRRIDARKLYTASNELEDQALQSLVGMLRLPPVDSEDNRIRLISTTPDAQQYYLTGRGFLQGRNESPENVDLAIDLFRRALEGDPSHALAFAGLGEAYWRKYEATRDTNWVRRAISYGRRAVRLRNDAAPVYYTLGIIYAGTGKPELALSQFGRALELDPDNYEAYSGLADAYERMGRSQEAEWHYRKAIALRPDYWIGYNSLGAFFFARGEYDRAAAEFRRVVQIAPHNATGYLNLGAVYGTQQRWKEATEYFQRSIELEPTEEGFTDLATTYFWHLQDYRRAAELYGRALELNPNNFLAQGHMAEALALTGQSEQAGKAFGRAVLLGESLRRVNPQDHKVTARLALYYANVGNRNAALSRAEEALALASDDADVLALVGLAYETLGSRRRAVTLINQALEAGYDAWAIEKVPSLAELRKDPNFRLPTRKP